MARHISRNAPHQTGELAKALMRSRRGKGLTQRELGVRLGLPQSHISLIEQGKVDLRLSSLIEMARVLDLEVALVPRQLVPAVRSLIEPRGEEEGFLYRLGGEIGQNGSEEGQ